MNTKYKSAITLAAVGVAGVSSQANATTFPLNYDSGQSYDIAIDSTTPQFYYDSGKYIFFNTAFFGTQNSGMFDSSLASGTASFDTTGTYSPDSGGIKVAGVIPISGPFYVNLSFENGGGQVEYGYASFDANDDLTGITTNGVGNVTITAVPEPSTWALLIAGAGAMGVAMHRRRRKQPRGVAA